MIVLLDELEKIKQEIKTYGEEFVKNYIIELYNEKSILEAKTCIKILHTLGLDDYIPTEEDLRSNPQKTSLTPFYNNLELETDLPLKLTKAREILDKNKILWYI
jgi:hypothetical protein